MCELCLSPDAAEKKNDSKIVYNELLASVVNTKTFVTSERQFSARFFFIEFMTLKIEIIDIRARYMLDLCAAPRAPRAPRDVCSACAPI